MSKTEHAPETQATKFLKTHKIPFSTHLYAYEEHGGTKVSARELNVDEHALSVRYRGMDNADFPLHKRESADYRSVHKSIRFFVAIKHLCPH